MNVRARCLAMVVVAGWCAGMAAAGAEEYRVAFGDNYGAVTPANLGTNWNLATSLARTGGWVDYTTGAVSGVTGSGTGFTLIHSSGIWTSGNVGWVVTMAGAGIFASYPGSATACTYTCSGLNPSLTYHVELAASYYEAGKSTVASYKMNGAWANANHLGTKSGNVGQDWNAASADGDWMIWDAVTPTAAGVITLSAAPPTGGYAVINAMRLVANAVPASMALAVNNGTGSGRYTVGTVVPITAGVASPGQIFDCWTGDVDHLASSVLASTTVTMPDHAVSVAATYRSTTGDMTPDDFSFADQTGVAISSVVVSDAILISGLTAAAPVTIAGGEYRLDSGAWTGAAGSVTNGQRITLRATAAGVSATAKNVTLNIGGVSDVWTVTTLPLATAQPDFIVSGLVISPVLPAVGGRFKVTVTVKNVGGQSGKAGYLHLYADKAASAAIGEKGNAAKAFSTLKPGQSKSVTVNLVAPATWGACTLRAFIDARGATAEADESNNQTTLDYRTGLPDFAILNVAFSPDPPVAGKTFSAYVTVANAGEVAGDAGMLVLWANYTGGSLPQPGAKTKGDKSKTVGVLQPGQQKAVAVTGLKAPSGGGTFAGLIDGRGKTLEIREVEIYPEDPGQIKETYVSSGGGGGTGGGAMTATVNGGAFAATKVAGAYMPPNELFPGTFGGMLYIAGYAGTNKILLCVESPDSGHVTPGTYSVVMGEASYTTGGVTYNTNIFLGGEVTITAFSWPAKTAKGTFWFSASQGSATPNFQITGGAFEVSGIREFSDGGVP